MPTQTTPSEPSLVERLRISEDKTLKRLAPFLRRVLRFTKTSSYATTMEGHLRLIKFRASLTICGAKEKRDSMFHTVQWSSEHSMSTPPLKAIKIWAHLTGVPLDLRHQEGLSLVAGLVGDPKETDDFTRNLVSLTLSHVKVEVDLTQPLPSVVEFQRQSGEVVEVLVHYPWIPPTCSHCHELGHLVRNCLLLPPPSVQNTPKQNHPQSNSPQSNLPIQNPFETNHPKQAPANPFSTPIPKSTPKNAPTRTYDQMVIDPPLLTALPTESSSDHSTDPVEALAFLSNPLTPIFSTRPPTENPNSSLDFLHLVPRLTSEVPPSSSQ
ncbi:unnamed protein product [Brassica napus]|uniref:(rape) hypothetical protein n=1 Tax=Brassica napus TaxID=3708 RepID=A0A816KW22_BRANA|nr:unnamed protein product [Brassica napus]